MVPKSSNTASGQTTANSTTVLPRRLMLFLIRAGMDRFSQRVGGRCVMASPLSRLDRASSLTGSMSLRWTWLEDW